MKVGFFNYGTIKINKIKKIEKKILKISEIGLNHMGEEEKLFQYLHYLKKKKLYGITIQVLKDSFYKKKKFKKFKLSLSTVVKFVKLVKKSGKKIGLAIDDVKQVDFFEKIKIDFYKILSKDFKNIELIKKLTKTKAKYIYLSTGLSDYREIDLVLSKINLKKIVLIHTSFKKLNFNRIDDLKILFGLPVAYGNHSVLLSSIYKCIFFKPHSIFFYAKLNKSFNFPDNKYAFKLKNVKKLLNKIDQNYKLIRNK